MAWLLDAQAEAVMKFGPCRLNRMLRLPAMAFAIIRGTK